MAKRVTLDDVMAVLLQQSARIEALEAQEKKEAKQGKPAKGKPAKAPKAETVYYDYSGDDFSDSEGPLLFHEDNYSFDADDDSDSYGSPRADARREAAAEREAHDREMRKAAKAAKRAAQGDPTVRAATSGVRSAPISRAQANSIAASVGGPRGLFHTPPYSKEDVHKRLLQADWTYGDADSLIKQLSKAACYGRTTDPDRIKRARLIIKAFGTEIDKLPE